MMSNNSATPSDEVDYVSGRTRLLGIIGDPIVQVKSPEIFTAELRRRGHEAMVVPLHVPPPHFDACLAGLMHLGNLDGLIFTIPYKARASALATTLGEQARIIGAINALARDGETWKGEIFDGLGCVEAFRRRGHAIAGRRIMLLGAGGAGSAIAAAVASQNPHSLDIFDVDAARARALVDRIKAAMPGASVRPSPAHASDIDILMNATPVGMLEDARLPLQIESLFSNIIVFDVVVKPERTPLLRLAESSGCPIVTGREMMLGQMSRMLEFFGFSA